MTKPTITAEVESLTHDGRGVASHLNKKLFIQGALPSEKVSCEVIKKHERYDEAKMIELVTPSTERTNPPCPHFGVCGGCSLQHMAPDLQLQMKQQTLLEQLNHFGNVQPENILAPLNANTTGYRRKARLGVKFVIKKNKVLVGFREKSSRYLADLNECHTLHPAVGLKLLTLSELIASLSIKEHIPQIEVAIGDHEVALVFRHMRDFNENDIEKLKCFAKKEEMQVYLQPNSPAPLTKLYPEDSIERLHYSLPQHNITFRFHPLDFTQINLELNQLMVEQAIRLLDLQKTDNVLDLFCGIGNFSLPLAKYANQVTGIEGDIEMVKRAQENATYNHIDNVNFDMCNLFQPNADAHWLRQQYHKILLDPPRTGAKEIIPFFKSLKASKIAYVSCNPATLARDAGELVHNCGYRLTHAGIMNMFPHTAHTEAMAIFEK